MADCWLPVHNDPSYNTVERRYYDPGDRSWSAKRCKVQHIRVNACDPEPVLTQRGPNPRWFNDKEEVEEVAAKGRQYLDQFRTLKETLSQYAWTDIQYDAFTQAEIIEQIKCIERGLYYPDEEISELHDTNYDPDKLDHYTKLIRALDSVTTFLEQLYEFEDIRDISNQHGAIHHEYFHNFRSENIVLSDNKNKLFVEHGTITKKLLNDEYFFAVIIYLSRVLGISSEDQISRKTVKHIILDIDAIENNIPPPTFVKCDKGNLIYRAEMMSRFPPPRWMDLPWTTEHPLESESLPGKFPESPQPSRLDYGFHPGEMKRVPYAATRRLPPPLSSFRSGPGSLDSPSKKAPPEPVWKAVNASRIDKEKSLIRCRTCKNMPWKCNVVKCPISKTRTAKQAPLSPHHSPHHRTAPMPRGILRRNRLNAQALVDQFENQHISSTSGPIDAPDISPPEPNALIQPQQYLGESLQHHFNEPSSPEAPQSQSHASKEYILHLQKEARAALETRQAEELKKKLEKTGGLRPPNKKLVDKLSDEAIHRIQSTLAAGFTTNLAVTGEGVELRRSDFAKVVPPTEWLNDEIVNGALNWLDKAVNSAAGIKNVRIQTRKCAVFNSFFFKMLREQGVKKGVRPLGRMGIKKENFFEVDTLLLPICENSHWTLLVIRPSKRTVSHMDSLNPRGNMEFIKTASEWLNEFLQDDYVGKEWTIVSHEAPRQVNGWDCGVHIITNAMCLALSLNPIETYLAGDMPMQRLRVAGMLLNGGYHGDYSLQAF